MTMMPVARHEPYGAEAATARRMATLADRLYAAWTESELVPRAKLLSTCCTPEVVYANPLGEAVGVARLAELIVEFLAPYPGHRPVRTSGVDVHHHCARWEWGLRDSIGQIVLVGLDAVTFTDEPRLATVSTFFGAPPRRVYSIGSTTV
ncbi:hypothetical protein [Frankia sp. AgKG'84/4]|uniref:hypothetical protein n=1 Tax=Frankia sp. AgKG'84/4 TaxID=573490 RepID=UPI00200F278A|nr:hypothetical protein [Frankia sp. AgKG'84/4]MCL9792940.1 hypothetical protein [Frankia sp. AgKG'84/4]